MDSFENAYNEMITMLKKIEFADENFIGVISTPNFVDLLKALYEADESSDTSDIYLQCINKGFRICDLQRALCLLNNEQYDGDNNSFCSFEPKSPDMIAADDNYQLELETEPINEYFYSLSFMSEEEACIGQKNYIRIASNYFSTDSIMKEVAEVDGLSIYDDNLENIVPERLCKICYETSKIDIKKIGVSEKFNEILLKCKDADALGWVYYFIREYTSNLENKIGTENCLLKLRSYIMQMDEVYKNVLLERIIADNNIIDKLNASKIYRICDFLEKKPRNISLIEIKEAFDLIQKIDMIMPNKVFEDWVHKLSPRELYVISKRYLVSKLMTLEEVGQICNVSRERIRQVESKAIRNMLSPKRNKYRRLLNDQLKLLSPHKSYITIPELETLGLQTNIAIFLDKVVGDIIYERAYNACFFSRASIDALDESFENLPNEFTVEDLEEYSVLISEELNGAFSSNEVSDLIRSKFRI